MMAEHIRNPIEWGFDQTRFAAVTVGLLDRSVRGSQESSDGAMPPVRQIKAADLRDVWSEVSAISGHIGPT
jgi:hypothetical protein